MGWSGFSLKNEARFTVHGLPTANSAKIITGADTGLR